MKNIKIYSVTVENQELLFNYAKNAKAESKEVLKIEIELKDFKELLLTGVLQDADEYIETRARQLRKMQPSKLNKFHKEIIKQAESLGAGQVEGEEAEAEVKAVVEKKQQPQEEKKEEKNSVDIAAVLEQMEKMQNQLNSVILENEKLKAKQTNRLTRQELNKWYAEIDDKEEKIRTFKTALLNINEMLTALNDSDLFTGNYSLTLNSGSDYNKISISNQEVIIDLIEGLKIKVSQKTKQLQAELENLKNL